MTETYSAQPKGKSTAKRRSAKSKRRAKGPQKVSRLQRPQNMSLYEWQVALRRQFGREQKFEYKNLGSQPVFSDFQVTNPTSGGVYRVAIRGAGLGESYCSCPDFATNNLGTCKHIEFMLGMLEANRLMKKLLAQGYKPGHSTVYLRYGAQRMVFFRPGTDCPPEFVALAARYFDPSGQLKPAAFHTFDEFRQQAAAIPHDLHCYSDVLDFIAEVRDHAQRQRLLDQHFPQGEASPALEKILKVPLYAYQREGALFAARAGRCLIGDEMGLGKTIQAIAAVEIMARHCGVERVLIICPTSLKHQWKREIEKFSQRSAEVITGLQKHRATLFATPTCFKITNYDTVYRDAGVISQWAPDLVILDEAQRIKNWNTRVARSVKKITSPFAIVLTGTPLENRLEELVSIVQFVDKHRLGPTFEFLSTHQLHDEDSGKVIGYTKLDAIGRTLAPILIRRRKDAVLKQLPPRLDKNFFVPMTPQQMSHHNENRELLAAIVAKWRRMKFLSEGDRRRMMVFLQNMRMSCDSTYLLDPQTDFGFKCGELAALLEDLFEKPDTKVVIFSQWLRMHELLARRIEDRGWGYVLFHGGVPSHQRGALVDRFREDKACRVFLATDAGGVGLNLQHAASVVINMDLPWNPAVLEQRIGRVHRLGQVQPVQVVNFVAQGTIEEGMLSVLKFKKSLFAGALDSGDPEIFLGGSRLKKFMETVEKTTGSIPQPEDQQSDAATTPTPTGEAADLHESAAAAPVPSTPPTQPAEITSPSGINDPSSRQPAPADSLGQLLQLGLTLLEELAQQSRHAGSPPREVGTKPDASAHLNLNLVHRDPATGESYVKIPMPRPAVLDKVLSTIGTLLEGFRGGRVQ